MGRRRTRKTGRLLLVGVILSVIAAAWLWSAVPDVSSLKSQFPLVRYRGPDRPPDILLLKSRPADWVPLAGISKVAIAAVMVSEDWAFYQHRGYDLNQIKEAIKEDWEEKRFARGASTITQQVARNVYLGKEKNLFRKGRELLIALQMERHLKKRKILEIYLNIAEWGPGLYGIGPAARHYFGKSPAALSAKEGAFLAMLLPSPRRYSQSFRDKRLTAYARDTVNDILLKMVQAGYLTEVEHAIESVEPLSFEGA